MDNHSEIQCRERMRAMGCAVVVPTYNNCATLAGVVSGVRCYCDDVIVVNDGSTDTTAEVLDSLEGVTVISYTVNKGKGHALKTGLRHAAANGFRYAVTIDSDGQHYPEDIKLLLDACDETPEALLIGSRNLRQENMPSKNTFANKFSNFWFRLETGKKLEDTQSGFRLYPLEKIAGMKFCTSKYEFELEIIVRAAWKDTDVRNVPVRVHYPPEGERVSHFKPLRDFTRISILNSVLVTIAALVYWPCRFFRALTMKNAREFMRKYITQSTESNLRMSMAISLGVFWGIAPVWGYQMILAGVSAHLLKLNKVVAVVSSNISIPPMIPFIVYGSYVTGGIVMNRPILITFRNISLEAVAEGLVQYMIGAVIFGTLCAVVIGSVSYLLMSLYRKGAVRE